MGNGINDRQNKKYTLSCLAAQSQIYTDAKNLELWQFVLCVILPFGMAIVRWFANDISWDAAYFIIALLIVFIDCLFLTFMSNNKECASKIQERIDRIIYKISWDEVRYGNKDALCQKIINGSLKYKRINKNYDRFINWYSDKYDKLEIFDGIFQCQKTNLNWDDSLRKYCMKLLIIAFLIILAIVIILFIMVQINQNQIVSIAILMIPIWKYYISDVIKIAKDIRRLNNIKVVINHIEDLHGQHRISDLLLLQNLIYEHRKKCYLIPDYIYKLRKDHQEKKAIEVAKMIVENRGGNL